MRTRNRIWAAITISFITAIFAPASLWPWGRLGHRVTARMAWDRLTPQASTAVINILGAGVSLADVSTWADEQREIPGTGPWHYVNIPITESRYDRKFCQRGGCVVSEIEDFKRVLMDPRTGKDEKQRALKFLVHLIADLHQPLHIGDNNDKGGNLLQVRFFNVESNLHRVWDSQIMEHHTNNEQVWLWDLTFFANPKMVAEWSKGTPEDWATESLDAARVVYRLPGTNTLIKPGTNLGKEYCSFALPMIQRQLARSGIRVAATLNTIFK